MALKPITWLQEAIPGTSRDGAYRIAKANPDLTVRFGKKIFIDDRKFEAFIDAGGRGLDVPTIGTGSERGAA